MDPLDPETRRIVNAFGAELREAVQARNQDREDLLQTVLNKLNSCETRIGAVESALIKFGELEVRVTAIDSAKLEQSIRADERKIVTTEQRARLAPWRDSLIRRAVDIVIMLLGAGALVKLGVISGLIVTAPTP